MRKRCFENFKEDIFINELKATMWWDIYRSEDVNEAAALLTYKLTNILNKLAPIKTFQVRKNYCAWMSHESKNLIKERNEAQRTASRTQRPEDWSYYKKLRNRVNNRLNYEKTNSAKIKLAQCIGNSKDTWKCVKNILSWSSGGPPNQLVHEGVLLLKPAEMSETMNTFFIDKVSKLAKIFPTILEIH